MKLLASHFRRRSVYIIGGGPSLAGFDFTRLKDKVTIGCNRAALDAPAKILFSVDPNFQNAFEKDINAFPGIVRLACRKLDDFDRFPVCDRKFLWDKSSCDLSEHPDIIGGKNAAFCAINLALHEGFKIIHLLGVDLNTSGHWHGGYGHTQSVGIMRQWAVDFDNAAPVLARHDVKLFNYSPYGAVKAYPFRNLKDIR